jgi:hypothetical protein
MATRQEMSRSVNIEEEGCGLILPKIKDMSAEKNSHKKER